MSLDPTLVPTAPATLTRRAMARAVDMATVVAWVWAMSVAHLLYYVPRWSDDVAPEPWGRFFLIGMSIAVLAFVYEVAFTSRTGATPGKDLMHLKVVDASTGATPSLTQALRRALPLGAVWVVPGIWGAVPLTVAIGATAAPSAGRRGLHDLVGGTSVVAVAPDEPRPGQSREEATAERRSHFMPRFVDPIQVLPSQIFRHPGAPRPGGPGLADEEPSDR
jgi:uncharacterized RDD family membrane protein YckC